MNNTLHTPFVRLLSHSNFNTDRRLKNFIGLFLDLGYEVEVVLANPISEISGANSINDVVFVTLPPPVRSTNLFLYYDTVLHKYLQTSAECDILFACELYSLNAGAKAKKDGLAKKLIYDARELYTELPTVSHNLLKKIFWKRWERKGLKQTDLIIVTAPDDANAIKHVHGFLPQHIVVRNFPKHEKLKANDYLRLHFRILRDKKIFVYVGGLQQDRGLEKMIDAMATLNNIAAFVMIGDGILKEDLQRKVRALALADDIFFHPAIDSEKLIEILSSADVGISLIEPYSKSYALALPSKVFEYMLGGLPVVCSPLSQVKELLHGTEGIFFADPENQKEIIAACQKASEISNDQVLRNKLHDNAAKNFTFETEAGVLKQFLSPNT